MTKKDSKDKDVEKKSVKEDNTSKKEKLTPKEKLNLDSKLKEASDDKKSLLNSKDSDNEEIEIPDMENNDFEITKNKELEKIHEKIMSATESNSEIKVEHKKDIPEKNKSNFENLNDDFSKKDITSNSDLQEIKELMQDFIDVFRKAAEEIKDDDFQTLQRKVEHVTEQNNVIASSLAKIVASLNTLHVKITDIPTKTDIPTNNQTQPVSTLDAILHSPGENKSFVPKAPEAPPLPGNSNPTLPNQTPEQQTPVVGLNISTQAQQQANVPMPPPVASPDKTGNPPSQQPAVEKKKSKGFFGLKLN